MCVCAICNNSSTKPTQTTQHQIKTNQLQINNKREKEEEDEKAATNHTALHCIQTTTTTATAHSSQRSLVINYCFTYHTAIAVAIV